MKVLISFVFAVILSANVFAQIEGNPENWCRNGLFPRENVDYSILTVLGKKGEKIYFYGDESENCPNSEKCRQKSYVIPGDKVIISRKYGNYFCAWFQPKKGYETVGWISAEKLGYPMVMHLEKKRDLTGTWTFYDNEIRIEKGAKPNTFKVSGEAFWKGLGDNIHTGELDHEGVIVGEDLKLGENDNDEYDCKVTLKLVGKYLIVSDNMNCGGANVTFSGVYQQTKNK
ncbi:MAG TPA: hypothetical protein PKY59_13830 [Pyrinomonadaceae bacterium]|nr:hypothetical protein [Pyrinomonadaceae bacterium]